MTGVLEKANRAKRAYLACVGLESRVKDKALNAIANALVASKKRILEANKLDLQAAAKAGLPDALIARLKLSGEKIDAMALGVRSVARLSDPVGRTLQSTELDKNLILYKVSTSIGVIGFIFESRPDVVAQIASLSLKSGNSVVLKGGSEALHSNRVLCEVIEKASAESGIPKGWIQLLESRRDVEEMLSMNGLIDLIIPRGSKQLVEHIQKNSRIPVLGHAEGICHAFVDRDADLKKAVKVCHDAKVQYPAVCNAIETLLVDGNIAKEFLPEIARDYEKAGVELRVDEKSRKILKDFNTKKAVEADWTTEYNDLIISIKVVSGVDEAIEHINTFGSHHTDAIITENKKTARKFLQNVDSSSVMHNCSTRFADGYRYGLGAEVGISTGKFHARGPVGLEGLTSYKYILEGDGQEVKDYLGGKARKYTHRKLEKSW
jgi:glutamate-5-semialdehyde dehydrogenase